MQPRYAGIGTAAAPWNITVTTGGNLSGGVIYFAYQLQNRAGLNIASYSDAINYSAGDKIIVSIPAAGQAWDAHYYLLSASANTDPVTFVQIARVAGYQFGSGISPQSVKTNFPYTFEITEDNQLELAPTVNDFPALPTNPLDGTVRWVTSLSKFFEYQADSTASPDNANIIAADVGNWHYLGNPATYIASTTEGSGCDRAIYDVNPATVIPTPSYPASTSRVLPDWEAKYWLYNDNTEALPSGTEFGIELEYNNRKSPDLLSGLFLVRFDGFVQSDGSYRTTDTEGRTFNNLGGYLPWTPKRTAPFITQDELQPGEAIALSVKPFFSAADLNNQLTANSFIGILPSIRTQSGDYNTLGKLLPKGVVYTDADKYRVVPELGLSFIILGGNALVASYDFPVKPAQTIGGLQPNLAGQQVIINGNGAVFLESPSYTPLDSEAIRAIIGTESGEGNVSPESAVVNISGGGVEVVVGYPCDAEGLGVIRSDYPDVIAGNGKGKFNPVAVNIYLTRTDTGEIRKFEGFNVIPQENQVFNITDWDSGNIVTAYGTPLSTNFSIFTHPAATLSDGGSGNFPPTTYKVAASFSYDGNQITSISHATPPCIPEWEGDFSPASVAIGNVVTLNSGEDATVVNVGTSNNVVLDIGLPRGDKGEAGNSATIVINDVSTTPPDQLPTVSNVGDSTNALLNFTFPDVPNFTVSSVVDGESPNVALNSVGGDYEFDFVLGRGEQGIQGEPGSAATIDVNGVDYVSPNLPPTVTNVGDDTNALLNFNLPSAPKITIGDVSTGDAVSVSNTGEDGNVKLNFVLEKGEKGDKGDIGSSGTVSSTGGLVLVPISEPFPDTGSDEYLLFIDAADGVLKLKAPSNGEISVVGSGGNGSDNGNPSVDLFYDSDGDTNGVFYYLGTNEGVSGTYTNPYNVNLIAFEYKNSPFGEPNQLSDRAQTSSNALFSADSPEEYVIIDLTNKELQLNYYSLQKAQNLFFLDWSFQGSVDKISWDILDTQSSTSSTSYAWESNPVSTSNYYRYFKMQMIGANSQGSNTLCISEIELYGKLRDINHPTSDSGYPEGAALLLEGSLTDTSGNGRNAFPNAFPPTTATGIDSQPVLRWDGSGSQEIEVSAFLNNAFGATLYCVYTVNSVVNDNHYNLARTTNLDDFWYYSYNNNGYIGTFLGTRTENYPLEMPSSGSHLISIHATSDNYEVLIDEVSKGNPPSHNFNLGDRFVISPNDRPFNGDLALMLVYPQFIPPGSANHQAIVSAIGVNFPSLGL